MAKAIFLDKDGTLIPDVPYNVDPELISLQPDSVDGLKKLYSIGYLLVIVSNQSGIARGYFAEDQLQAVKQKIEALLEFNGIFISGFYYCPHHPEGIVEKYKADCDCRKPQPGMLLKAATELDIDLSRSWMIGDILNDVEAGNRGGCKSILVDNGNETEWLTDDYRTPTFTCNNINQAAELILKHQSYEQLDAV